MVPEAPEGPMPNPRGGIVRLRVMDLEPGDRFTMRSPFTRTGEQLSTFVQQCQHPIWSRLQLVIWRMDDGTWSHNALDPRQELPGTIDRPTSQSKREARLRRALLESP